MNVHVPYAGEIDGTDLFIPSEVVEARAGQLPDKGAQVLLYCQTGRMSAIAAETLVGLGYTNVVELGGGMEAWEAAGYPLEQRAGG